MTELTLKRIEKIREKLVDLQSDMQDLLEIAEAEATEEQIDSIDETCDSLDYILEELDNLLVE